MHKQKSLFATLATCIFVSACTPPNPTALALSPTSSATKTLPPAATLTLTASPTVNLTPSPTPTADPADDRVLYQGESLILYRKGYTICSQQQGRQPVFLAHLPVRRLQPSPDEKLIMFSKVHSTEVNNTDISWEELWVMEADGSNQRKLIDLSEFTLLKPYLNLPSGSYTVHFVNPVWIPRTHEIVFATSHLDINIYPNYPTNQYHNDLHIVDADTGNLRTLLSPDDGGSKILPSPDGHSIAIITRGEYVLDPGETYARITVPDSISIINIDGTNWRPDILSYDGPIVPLNNGYVYHDPGLVWSPDSSGVYAALFPKNPRKADNQAEVVGWFIPVTDAPKTIYHLEGLNFNPYEFYDPVLSPDGRYLAFKAVYQGRGGLHIFDTVTKSETVYFEDQYVRFEGWDTDSWHFSVFADNSETDDPYDIILLRGFVSGTFVPIEEPKFELQDCSP